MTITLIALLIIPLAVFARTWPEAEFAHRPLMPYPLPPPHDGLIGAPISFTIEKGDTLLDIGRWYGLSGTEISDANGKLDWWAPPAGRQIILPTEHILPEGPRTGIVMNIPEMRIYYYYPSATVGRRHRGKITKAGLKGMQPRVVYTFPVGLGRFDWKTPVASWRVTGKIVNPTWVVPQDIYEEHLERDGEAEHVVQGGDPDNPLGHYKLALSLPEYAIHGTDVPWGVGMNVSHGCIRLYPEDIERLFNKTPVGTTGRFVYQPVKFGWRGNNLYVEVHEDLYAVYPGLWNHAMHEVKRLHLEPSVDLNKLEKAIAAKSGMPTYVMNGPAPAPNIESASASFFPPPPGLTGEPSIASISGPDETAPESAPDMTSTVAKRATSEPDADTPTMTDPDAAAPSDSGDVGSAPATDYTAPPPAEAAPAGHDDWSRLPTSHIVNDDSSE